jgi:hypothetical protein
MLPRQPVFSHLNYVIRRIAYIKAETAISSSSLRKIGDTGCLRAPDPVKLIAFCR